MTSKFLSILTFALAASVLPAHATAISLTLLSPASGDFDVAVQLTGVFDSHPGDAVAAFGFNVVTDPAFLSFTGETIGPLFDDFSGIFGPSPQVAGTATSGFLASGDFTEPLVLAILHFHAVGQGSTSIGIATDLSDPNQGLLYLSATDPLNATTTVNVVPEPATFLLGGLALLLTARLRIHAR